MSRLIKINCTWSVLRWNSAFRERRKIRAENRCSDDVRLARLSIPLPPATPLVIFILTLVSSPEADTTVSTFSRYPRSIDRDETSVRKRVEEKRGRRKKGRNKGEGGWKEKDTVLRGWECFIHAAYRVPPVSLNAGTVNVVSNFNYKPGWTRVFRNAPGMWN